MKEKERDKDAHMHKMSQHLIWTPLSTSNQSQEVRIRTNHRSKMRNIRITGHFYRLSHFNRLTVKEQAGDRSMEHRHST